MSFPSVPLPTATVRVGDTDVPIRGLTLAEVRQVMSDDVSPDEADALCLSWATGWPLDGTRAWLGSVPAGVQLELLGAVRDLSGMGEGAQFRG